MRLTMELTLDGLVRALRLRAHGLAEDAEAGYVRPRARRSTKRRKPMDEEKGKKRDDRGGR